MTTTWVCSRCGQPMEEGKLHIEQQPFPLEWVKLIAGLNDGTGRSVFGWGRAAAESKARRAAWNASRKSITAVRCTTCGNVELFAN